MLRPVLCNHLNIRATHKKVVDECKHNFKQYYVTPYLKCFSETNVCCHSYGLNIFLIDYGNGIWHV